MRKYSIAAEDFKVKIRTDPPSIAKTPQPIESEDRTLERAGLLGIVVSGVPFELATEGLSSKPNTCFARAPPDKALAVPRLPRPVAQYTTGSNAREVSVTLEANQRWSSRRF